MRRVGGKRAPALDTTFAKTRCKLVRLGSTLSPLATGATCFIHFDLSSRRRRPPAARPRPAAARRRAEYPLAPSRCLRRLSLRLSPGPRRSHGAASSLCAAGRRRGWRSCPRRRRRGRRARGAACVRALLTHSPPTHHLLTTYSPPTHHLLTAYALPRYRCHACTYCHVLPPCARARSGSRPA